MTFEKQIILLFKSLYSKFPLILGKNMHVEPQFFFNITKALEKGEWEHLCVVCVSVLHI